MTGYDLDSLGWFQFERLCQSLLKARCGLALEAWGGRGDLGRDAYAAGGLTFPDRESNEGPFIFQAKFVEDASGAGADPRPALIRAVRAELAEITRREAKSWWRDPAFFALLTNAPLDGTGREEVREILEAGLPETRIVIEAGPDIDALLDDSPRIRLAFPQILGLRDIYALLDERVDKEILKRSSLGLDIAKELAATFVATEAYAKALGVLDREHFVVLTGPPEMGKTTIAWMVALARLTGGWEAYECRSPQDFFRVHDTDREQVFVVDDAFGSTEYDPYRATLWADELEKVIHALDYRHWLLLTSRPAPLKTALERLNVRGAAERFPHPHEVLVDASELSVEEKAQMLYRHAKVAVADPRGRDLIRAVAGPVVAHRHFTPLRIHRFVSMQVPTLVEQPTSLQRGLAEEAALGNLERPTREMTTSFHQLEEECKVLLIAMLDSPGGAIELDALAASFERHLGRPPARPTEAAAELIADHFIRISTWARPFGEEEEYQRVEWVHPSVRDLVIDHLTGDASARREFLGRAGIDGVMLGLSSEGGTAGERLFPLLADDEDWRAMIARMAAMAPDLSAAGRDRLAALLENTARLAGAEEAIGRREDLRELTRVGLESLRAQWSATEETIDNGALRSYYRAAATLQPPVGGPDLRATWAERTEILGDYTWDSTEVEFQVAEEWVELVELLSRYEPMWLIGFDFPDGHRAVAEKVVALIEREDELLGVPEIYDDEDPGEYVEPPPDLEWVTVAERILATVGELDPELRDRAADVPGHLDEKTRVWQEYGERHEAVGKRERGDGGDYEERADAVAEEFDVESFFVDL